MAHDTMALILEFAPDFCYVSAHDLYQMIVHEHENLTWESFNVCLWKLKQRGHFDVKMNRYTDKLYMTSEKRRNNGLEKLYLNLRIKK